MPNRIEDEPEQQQLPLEEEDKSSMMDATIPDEVIFRELKKENTENLDGFCMTFQGTINIFYL